MERINAGTTVTENIASGRARFRGIGVTVLKVTWVGSIDHGQTFGRGWKSACSGTGNSPGDIAFNALGIAACRGDRFRKSDCIRGSVNNTGNIAVERTCAAGIGSGLSAAEESA